MGQKVASEGVTIVDDGTIDNRRGSLTNDDEGTPTERTVLIENGILKNFMQDRHNARLMRIWKKRKLQTYCFAKDEKYNDVKWQSNSR